MNFWSKTSSIHIITTILRKNEWDTYYRRRNAFFFLHFSFQTHHYLIVLCLRVWVCELYGWLNFMKSWILYFLNQLFLNLVVLIRFNHPTIMNYFDYFFSLIFLFFLSLGIIIIWECFSTLFWYVLCVWF